MNNDTLDQIEKLYELKNKGILTEEEFQNKKASLLREDEAAVTIGAGTKSSTGLATINPPESAAAKFIGASGLKGILLLLVAAAAAIITAGTAVLALIDVLIGGK